MNSNSHHYDSHSLSNANPGTDDASWMLYLIGTVLVIAGLVLLAMFSYG